MSEQSDRKTSVLVIGGGPGGYVAAIRASQLGADVTLVEKDRVGGTCLNRGCIPSKVLLHSADAYDTARFSEPIGVKSGEVVLNWDTVQKRRRDVVTQLTGGVAGLLAANRVKVVPGTATFVAPKEILVKNGENAQRLTADRIIIATGSEASVPPIPGTKDNPDCIDSTACLALDRVPESLIIIGGGVIGLELGSAYRSFGSKVTVVEMLPRLLAPMDYELTNILTRNLKSAGMEIFLNSPAKSVEKVEDGSVLTFTVNGEDQTRKAEKILICVGRRPVTKGLGLEEFGYEMNRGFIVTNDRLETSVPDVYAIGDCNGKLMLAHTAMAMGEVAAENAVTGSRTVWSSETAPSVVYVGPEFAGVGLNEEQVKEKAIPYIVGRFPTAANGRSLILGETRGMMKVIAEAETKRILGVHILGATAGEIIQEAAMAIRFHATLDEFISTIHGHPSVSEALREAALAAEKRCIHMPNR